MQYPLFLSKKWGTIKVVCLVRTFVQDLPPSEVLNNPFGEPKITVEGIQKLHLEKRFETRIRYIRCKQLPVVTPVGRFVKMSHLTIANPFELSRKSKMKFGPLPVPSYTSFQVVPVSVVLYMPLL